MKKGFGTLILAASLMGSPLHGAFAATADTVATAEQTWEVAVGKATEDGVSLDSMFPNVIYVYEGDTINFKNQSFYTPHTVTFLAGNAPLDPNAQQTMAPSAPSGGKWDGVSLLNSGMLEPGNSYSITFTQSGAFPYYCALHPLMRGTVVVLPKGQPMPSKEQQVAAAEAQKKELIAQAEALRNAKHGATQAKNPDGSFTYKMALGVGHSGFTVNRMLPETMVISEGDSIEWLNDNPYEIHWVTFNKPADMEMFTPQGLNPAFMPPAGGSTFDGTGFTNSGILMPGQTYKLGFTKPGTYEYECYLHSGDAMRGKVVVLPKDAVKVTVNGIPLVYNAKLPHIHNGHVYTSIKPFMEALGGNVTWDAKQRAVIANVGANHQVPSTLDASKGVKVVINGKQLSYGYDPAPHIHDGHSYAPVADMVNALGGSYTWNQATQMLEVTVPQVGQAKQTKPVQAPHGQQHEGHGQGAETVIDMKDMAYSKIEITIKKGSKITWTNSDAEPHTVTDLKGKFDSGNMNKGDTWSYTFHEAGTFEYYCQFHPEMAGKIVVTE